jgi:hypothetical protein
VGSRAARALAAGVAAALALAGASTAAPPDPGLLVAGQSLGGVRIGMTKAQVRRAWGTDFGRCRSCPRETWYFNYEPFLPEGVAVAFVRARVTHVFTLWQPAGWRTTRGLALGAAERDVTRLYGPLSRSVCDGYEALVLPGRRAQTVFYIDDGELWGFGLTRPSSSPCVEWRSDRPRTSPGA